ncbi:MULTISPECIES: hypothetical protein [unclassified Mesorhizobium]|uniref:hypothetical protein n=1 Tax=unclassified Mesorhizobium TaxID=325217 RepID=UPI003339BD63
MITTANDFLLERPGYDHFAGATLVPQALQLGRYLDWLGEVGGHATRLPRLWTGASDQVDSTAFELLVAARCAEMGRRVEFLPETSEASPDIRCHDPYPMVIECKRKRSLSDYELNEEADMKGIFGRLETEAGKKGLRGRFDLTLTVEAKACPKDEVVARLVSQRLAPNPERALAYPWGSVAYHPMPQTIFFGNQMRARSPDLLETAFGWNPDLPEWDGLIVRTAEMNGELIDAWRSPLALVWRNDAPKAIVKRAWSPVDLFGDAMGQIPSGEFGIVYLAYHEGAREEIADRRSRNLMDRLKAWEHAASIRVPISVLVRLYPRALGVGKPDLIESNVRLASGEYGEPALFSKFPTTIFTSTPSTQAGRS